MEPEAARARRSRNLANAGIAGTQKPAVLVPTSRFPGRWAADNDFFDASGEHSWGVRADLIVPIGNDTLDARYVQSKILLRRAKTNLRLQEQIVTVDVRNSVRDLQSAIDGVKAASARASPPETLRAEQERLRLGDSTPHRCSTSTRPALAEASRSARCRSTARRSRRSSAQGTLLEKLGIDVVAERERGVGEF
jgi:outer membrane protein TolC